MSEVNTRGSHATEYLLAVHRCDERMLVDKDQYEEELVITCPLPFCGYSWCRNCNKAVEDPQKRHFCENDGSSELQVLMDAHGWKLCPGESGRLMIVDLLTHTLQAVKHQPPSPRAATT